MGEEVLGSVKSCFPSVGECQGAEVERVVGRGNTFMEASGGGGKGITSEM